MATQSVSFPESLAIPPSQGMQERVNALKATSSKQLLLDGYLRREELAQQLGVSPRTIDRWQTSRCGPPRVAIGRTILYSTASVREWLQSKESSLGSRENRTPRFRPAGRR